MKRENNLVARDFLVCSQNVKGLVTVQSQHQHKKRNNNNNNTERQHNKKSTADSCRWFGLARIFRATAITDKTMTCKLHAVTLSAYIFV